jgi:hypothetical protein
MFPRRTKRGARTLLVASFIMVLEMACSHAPPPPDPRIESRNHEGKGVVVRFHTTDRVTFVTSSYTTTDSSVVINQVLRHTKYYAPKEAKLYEQTLTAPSRDLVFPVEIRFDEIKSMDTWEPRSVSADVAKGMAGMVVIVAAMVIAAIVAVRTGDGYP